MDVRALMASKSRSDLTRGEVAYSAHQDPRVYLAQTDRWVHQDQTANLDYRDDQDLWDLLAHRERKENKDHQVKTLQRIL